MGMVFTRPKLLISSFLKESSVWYGIMPFMIYMIVFDFSTLLAYTYGYWQSINPLPKILVIPSMILSGPLPGMLFR